MRNIFEQFSITRIIKAQQDTQLLYKADRSISGSVVKLNLKIEIWYIWHFYLSPV